MNHTQLIDELLQELSYRVGIVDIYNKEQQSIMSEILTEWGEFEVKETIFKFLNEDDEKKFKNPILNRKITYVGKDGKEREGLVGNLLTSPEDSPGRLEAEKLLPQDGTSERDAINQEIGSQGGGGDQTDTKGDGGTDSTQQDVQKGSGLKKGTKSGDSYQKNRVEPEIETQKKIDDEKSQSSDSEIDSISNEDIKEELDKTQSDLQQKRDMGTAGAGGAIASQGESRYCNTMNTLDTDEFKQKNEKQINEEVENLKSRTGRSKFPNASESETLSALGLNPNSDEAYEYIATREVFSKQELERIKNIPNSVFFLKGKKGFNSSDEAYLEWAKAAYDGTLATRKILDEDTDMDMSKPNTTIQSETDIDDNVESKISVKLEQSKQNGNQDDINYYTKQLKSFKKFRKYHDTYTVGQDSNGRMCVVSISNKKGDDLKDPQNNTTPAKRFSIIKEQYGEEVAKSVVQSLDTGIETVSDVKQASVKATNNIDIDDNIVKICELPEMKKYMDTLGDNSAFVKFVTDKGKGYSSLTTEEKLKLMQEHSNLLLATDKKPAFEPYGKIMTKVGEFSQKKKFRNENPSINFETSSISQCITIKQNEKNAVKSSHQTVVNDIKGADEKLGFPKDGKNGPHVQGYIGTVMDAMHFESYIDGGDGQIIIQMGIRGAQPKDIRNCLVEKSGYQGDVSTTEGRDGLKKHLKETSKIDSKSGAIQITNENGTTEICEDTWRTAGTSQKVASGFGSGMRDCIASKVDSRRNSQ